jgi:hypothetical protein
MAHSSRSRLTLLTDSAAQNAAPGPVYAKGEQTMSDVTQEGAKPPDTAPTAEAAGSASTKPAQVRKAFGALKKHPLGVIALMGAAVALIELELAVGILAGIGATALLTKKTGPEARQEVLAKGKWAVGRARALTTRGKEKEQAAASAAPTPPTAPAPQASPPA